jgi:hypothetical protein
MDSGRAFCMGKRGKLHQGQKCPSLDVANFHGSQTLLRVHYRHPRDCLPDRHKFQRTVVSLWPSTSLCAMQGLGFRKGPSLVVGADCVHHKYTKLECVLQAASNIDNWVAGIFYSREAVECHN